LSYHQDTKAPRKGGRDEEGINASDSSFCLHPFLGALVVKKEGKLAAGY
jgi:hypothetical protein